MKIYLGADHAGFELKEKIKEFLNSLGFQVFDEGAFSYEEEDDYPEICQMVARLVAGEAGGARGIIVGHSGQGEAIATNRFKGIRAVVYYGGPDEIIRLSRLHNDANILSLGAGFLSEEETKQAVKHWLETPFSSEIRHKRRIGQLDTDIPPPEVEEEF
jgi:ribose 5-phosphate isomerase B